MSRILKCWQCKKEVKDDESYYVGPKHPHCSVECAKKTCEELRTNRTAERSRADDPANPYKMANRPRRKRRPVVVDLPPADELSES